MAAAERPNFEWLAPSGYVLLVSLAGWLVGWPRWPPFARLASNQISAPNELRRGPQIGPKFLLFSDCNSSASLRNCNWHQAALFVCLFVCSSGGWRPANKRLPLLAAPFTLAQVRPQTMPRPWLKYSRAPGAHKAGPAGQLGAHLWRDQVESICFQLLTTSSSAAAAAATAAATAASIPSGAGAGGCLAGLQGALCASDFKGN